VFQIIVGSWEIGRLVAGEEPRPVAPRDAQKSRHGHTQESLGLPVLRYLRQEKAVGATQREDTLIGVVAQEVGSMMDPLVGAADVGPEGCGASEPSLEDALKPAQ
jgi:hypothetical protein